MSPRQTLHGLLNLAIEDWKSTHSDEIPELDVPESVPPETLPADYGIPLYDPTLLEVFAHRERDRLIARPIILRTLKTIIQSSTISDQSLRLEAIEYLGESWEYYNDREAVLNVLLIAAYDTSIEIQLAGIQALGAVGADAQEAIPALKVLAERSKDQQLRSVIQQVINDIGVSSLLGG